MLPMPVPSWYSSLFPRPFFVLKEMTEIQPKGRTVSSKAVLSQSEHGVLSSDSPRRDTRQLPHRAKPHRVVRVSHRYPPRGNRAVASADGSQHFPQKYVIPVSKSLLPRFRALSRKGPDDRLLCCANRVEHRPRTQQFQHSRLAPDRKRWKRRQ